LDVLPIESILEDNGLSREVKINVFN
jgi:hypothetical protein